MLRPLAAGRRLVRSARRLFQDTASSAKSVQGRGTIQAGADPTACGNTSRCTTDATIADADAGADEGSGHLRVLVAVGGNSLVSDGDLSAAGQMRAVQTTAAQIAQLIAAGHDVVVTHGNGPQVGLGMLRSDLAAGDAAVRAPAVPLDWLDAESEGSLGYILQQAIGNQPALVGRPAPAAVVTQVVVDAADPAFAAPSKPVGAYYTQTEAEARCTQAGDGWVMREQPGGQGWRRVVPSPRPQRVVELAAVEALLAHGVTAVCLGGGGIPVVEADDSGAEEARGNAADVVGRGDQRLVTRPLRGVAAVVDKDASSVLLADALGCDAVVFSTAVPCVYRDFGTPDQTPLGVLSADHAEALLADGQFGTGSMAPKVAAAVDFVTARRGGGGNVGKGGGHPAQRRRVAHVCEPSAIFDAVTISTDGQVGTTVVAAAETR